MQRGDRRVSEECRNRDIITKEVLSSDKTLPRLPVSKWQARAPTDYQSLLGLINMIRSLPKMNATLSTLCSLRCFSDTYDFKDMPRKETTCHVGGHLNVIQETKWGVLSLIHI